MRVLFCFLLFFQSLYAQEQKEVESNRFSHYIGINTYTMNFDFYTSKIDEFTRFGGNEFNYFFGFNKDDRTSFYLKSGVFYYCARSEKMHPNLNYIYIPLGLGVKRHFKKRPLLFFDFSLTVPLITYEDSKNTSNDKLWLNYEEAIYYANDYKNFTFLIEQMALGIEIKKKLYLTLGEIGYLNDIKSSPGFIFTPGFLLGVKYKVSG